MNKLMTATDGNYHTICLELTKEQRYEIKSLLNDTFNYCQQHDLKDQVDIRDTALFNLVCGKHLFNGFKSIRLETFYLYSFIGSNYQSSNKHIAANHQKIKKILGDETYNKFYGRLCHDINKHFK